jgi:hypothetical protein
MSVATTPDARGLQLQGMGSAAQQGKGFVCISRSFALLSMLDHGVSAVGRPKMSVPEHCVSFRRLL